MINTEILTVDDIIASYERIGYTLRENYTSVSIRQLKFNRGKTYIVFIWKADDWDFPLRNGNIDVYIVGEASYSSKARWAEIEGHKLPKELLYEATVTIGTEEKLILHLNNALVKNAIEELV